MGAGPGGREERRKQAHLEALVREDVDALSWEEPPRRTEADDCRFVKVVNSECRDCVSRLEWLGCDRNFAGGGCRGRGAGGGRGDEGGCGEEREKGGGDRMVCWCELSWEDGWVKEEEGVERGSRRGDCAADVEEEEVDRPATRALHRWIFPRSICSEVDAVEEIVMSGAVTCTSTKKFLWRARETCGVRAGVKGSECRASGRDCCGQRAPRPAA